MDTTAIAKNLLEGKVCDKCLLNWEHLDKNDHWERYCAFVKKYWHPKENTCKRWIKDENK